MRKPLSFGVASLLFAMSALWGSTLSGSQDRDEGAGIPEPFIGAWRLVALEVVDSDGAVVHRGDSTGMFVFTREGRLAVQVMDRTPRAAPHAGPEPSGVVSKRTSARPTSDSRRTISPTSTAPPRRSRSRARGILSSSNS